MQLAKLAMNIHELLMELMVCLMILINCWSTIFCLTSIANHPAIPTYTNIYQASTIINDQPNILAYHALVSTIINHQRSSALTQHAEVLPFLFDIDCKVDIEAELWIGVQVTQKIEDLIRYHESKSNTCIV